jgi:hypothetical protein
MIGLAAVLLMTQLGDGELHLLDQQRAVLRFALERARPASAASSAARVSRIIACAAAKSVGSFASETAPTIHRV